MRAGQRSEGLAGSPLVALRSVEIAQHYYSEKEVEDLAARKMPEGMGEATAAA